ncbi:hypothetical protein Ae201684P_018345 [Aphanomyces euteiches]|uniref:Uncharacterized protein n=1 Tax=Aphanomyces euteiches TaxID=100861 RepID=A0A6G0WG78_9STRA|nr:hypothetical protein Ae201684_015793 [Aphanomyces euteiches]KAH9099329.1 hypothetical protein Ae201684P_018345 [Aphanomyces euteiches]
MSSLEVVGRSADVATDSDMARTIAHARPCVATPAVKWDTSQASMSAHSPTANNLDTLSPAAPPRLRTKPEASAPERTLGKQDKLQPA